MRIGALKLNSTLTFLNLRDNRLGELGGQSIALALETNSTLVSLNLYGNAIHENIMARVESLLVGRIAQQTTGASFVSVKAAVAAQRCCVAQSLLRWSTGREVVYLA